MYALGLWHQYIGFGLIAKATKFERTLFKTLSNFNFGDQHASKQN